MLTLAKSLEFNEYVKPIRLAPLNHEASGKAISTGWGNANPTGSTPPITPDALQEVELYIIPQYDCRELYNETSVVDETMICAGDGPLKGACKYF